MLEAARLLKAEAPEALATRGGELEGQNWWEERGELFKAAHAEYGRLHPSLYEPSALEDYLHPPLLHALEAVRSGASTESIFLDDGLIKPTAAKGVYALRVFTPEFCKALLEELDHQQASGIPLRRPNGMNRYGAILGDLGFDAMLAVLRARVVAPLAQLLFHEDVGPADVASHYGFTVRYRPGEDVSLKEHADASTVTLNLCLGRRFEGGRLYFRGVRRPFAASGAPGAETVAAVEVGHEPGVALLHLGQHLHGVRPLVAGDRTNLVLWSFGEHGFVRIAPYPEFERSTFAQRWRPVARLR